MSNLDEITIDQSQYDQLVTIFSQAQAEPIPF